MSDGTLKVAKIEDHRPVTAAPAVRFRINATLSGFPVELEGETANAHNLKALVAKLREIGAEPPQENIKSGDATTDSAPVCRVHKSKLREGRHGYFCPKKVGDGYCKETA